MAKAAINRILYRHTNYGAPNGAKYTADALESVITGLQDKGYELVPISQLIYKDKYHMKADGTQVPGE